ncbi:MAG: ubiquitin [Oscillospiraceae bacterium]|nr:ubiquitin [Oscillospiraceae bacterium]
MTTLEQVEKLRERANVSFEEAKAALEEAGGDLLDALILLERQGKTAAPARGGSYSGAQHAPENEPRREGSAIHGGEGFKKFLREVGRIMIKLINRGNANYLDASHRGETKLSCPVTVLVVLLIFFFWIVVPLMIVGLFTGWRYRFRGEDLGRESVNSVIEKAESAAEELKSSVIGEKN